jgi:hypothetical protein
MWKQIEGLRGMEYEVDQSPVGFLYATDAAESTRYDSQRDDWRRRRLIHFDSLSWKADTIDEIATWRRGRFASASCYVAHAVFRAGVHGSGYYQTQTMQGSMKGAYCLLFS